MQNVTDTQNEINNARVRKILVQGGISVREAMKRMDEGQEKILIVVDESNKLCGTPNISASMTVDELCVMFTSTCLRSAGKGKSEA